MKPWIASALSVLLVSSVLAAEGPQLNDKEKAYFAQSLKQRAKRIVALEAAIIKQRQEISDLAKATVTTYEGKDVYTGKANAKAGRFASAAEKNKAIADTRDKLQTLAFEKQKCEDAANHFVPVLANLKEGEAGLLGAPDKPVKVVKVVDPTQVIIDIDGKAVLLAGFNTAGLSTSKPATISSVVEITGTYDFKAGSTPKTIPKAQPFDNANVRAYEAAHKKEVETQIEKAVAEAKGGPKT